jgi:hypothetical protein
MYPYAILEDTQQQSFTTGLRAPPNLATRVERGHHARFRVTYTLARDDHAPSTGNQYGHSKRRLDQRTAVNKAGGHERSGRSPSVPLGTAFLLETKTTKKQKPSYIVQKTWRDTITTGFNWKDKNFTALKAEKH